MNNDGCIVHFGSCSSHRARDRDFEDFRKRTGFVAVSGYSRDVDWIKSFAFDLLYLDQIVWDAPKKLTADYMESVRYELRERVWYSLGDALGFDIHTGER